METNQLTKKQQDIEQRWTEMQKVKPEPAKTLEQLYGKIEDWMLEIGDYQLMLYPVSGQWIYYDQIHDSWEDSGYKAGEAIFYLQDGEIFIEDLRISAPNIGVCSQCGAESIDAEARFCSQCGAVLN